MSDDPRVFYVGLRADGNTEETDGPGGWTVVGPPTTCAKMARRRAEALGYAGYWGLAAAAPVSPSGEVDLGGVILRRECGKGRSLAFR